MQPYPLRKWICISIVCVAACQPALATPPDGATPPPAITIRIYDYAGVAPVTLKQAQQIAARLLHRAGVPTAWAHCPLDLESVVPPACQAPRGPADIIFRINTHRMAVRAGFDSLGYAYQLPDGFSYLAAVNFDRAQQKARPPVALKVVLGHILAHEIGHLLLGHNRHSTSGLMGSAWDGAMLEQAGYGRLQFSAQESRRMLKKVQARLRAAHGEGAVMLSGLR